MQPSRQHSPLALVTGGNRGIGLEVARQLAATGVHVVIGARDAAGGRAAAEALAMPGLKIASVGLDVTDDASVSAALAEITERFGPLDILINNAAILIDGPGGFSASVFEMTDATLRRTLETNVVAPARLIAAVVPSMRARGYGRVVNVSSLAGQLAAMGAGYPAYRLSKAALNALTRTAAAELGSGDVKINSVCPGWCKTDMGGAEAERTAAKGAETIVWLALLPPDGPTGQFFKDKAPIAW